ncbi:hypothetical protein HDU93_008304 [Gonapodya sp. JEL0774]|nr:hypothetical protein HDU93_008304 [Gonapodya sp. JEL0774]
MSFFSNLVKGPATGENDQLLIDTLANSVAIRAKTGEIDWGVMMALVDIIDANVDKAPKMAVLHLLTVINENSHTSALASIAVLECLFETCKPRFRGKLAESKVIWKEMQKIVARQDLDETIRSALMATTYGWTTVPDKTLSKSFLQRYNETFAPSSKFRLTTNPATPKPESSRTPLHSSGASGISSTLSPTHSTFQFSSNDTVINLAELASSLEPHLRTLSDISAGLLEASLEMHRAPPDVSVIADADAAAARCQAALEELGGIMRRNADRDDVVANATSLVAEVEDAMNQYKRAMTLARSSNSDEKVGLNNLAVGANSGKGEKMKPLPSLSTSSSESVGSLGTGLSGALSASAVSTATSAAVMSLGGVDVGLRGTSVGTDAPTDAVVPKVPQLMIDRTLTSAESSPNLNGELATAPALPSSTPTPVLAPGSEPASHRLSDSAAVQPTATPSLPSETLPTATHSTTTVPHSITAATHTEPVSTAARNPSPSRPKGGGGGGIVFRPRTPDPESAADTLTPPHTNGLSLEPTPRSSDSSGKRVSLDEFGYDTVGKDSRPKNSHVEDFMKGQSAFLGPKRWGEKKLGKLPEGFHEAATGRKSIDSKATTEALKAESLRPFGTS